MALKALLEQHQVLVHAFTLLVTKSAAIRLKIVDVINCIMHLNGHVHRLQLEVFFQVLGQLSEIVLAVVAEKSVAVGNKRVEGVEL